MGLLILIALLIAQWWLAASSTGSPSPTPGRGHHLNKKFSRWFGRELTDSNDDPSEDVDSRIRLVLKPLFNFVQSKPERKHSLAVLCRIPLGTLLPDDPQSTESGVKVELLEYADGRKEKPPGWTIAGNEKSEHVYLVVPDDSSRAEVTLKQWGPSGEEPIIRMEIFYAATPGPSETMCTGFRYLFTYHPVEVTLENIPRGGDYKLSIEGCYGTRQPDWQGKTLIWVGDQTCTAHVVLRHKGLRAESEGLSVDHLTDFLSMRTPDLSELSNYKPEHLEELQEKIDRLTDSCNRHFGHRPDELTVCKQEWITSTQDELDAALEALDDLKEE